MSDELIEKVVKILSRWNGESHGSYFMANHPWECQETFAGFIYDNWEEAYEKNLAKPNIRQQVEDQIEDRIKDRIQMQIRMDTQKSWKERGI